MRQENHTLYQRVIYLISAVNNGSITKAEREELNAWRDASLSNRMLYDELTSAEKRNEALAVMGSFDTAQALSLVKQKMNMPRSRYGYLKIFIAAAACLLVFATVFFFRNAVQRPIEAYSMLPEGNKAVLITEDGKVITLDKEKGSEELPVGGNLKINAAAGVISYLVDKTKIEGPAELRYNTIKTPKGGQYEVVLSDGTRVLLNAGSVLTYPVQFGRDERRVKLLGEGYFEVSKDHRRPFLVESGEQIVRVLGTHFNVHAYEEDEVMTTSLLEGSIQLAGIRQSGRVLVPGEVATYNPASNDLKVEKLKVSELALWRSGYFQFADEPIEEVMKKISRWYNVDVVFKGDQTDDLFSGTITHYQKLQDVLTTLELTGKVKFKYNGKEVIVDKK